MRQIKLEIKRLPRNVRQAKRHIRCDTCGKVIPERSLYVIQNELYNHPIDDDGNCIIVWRSLDN